MNWLSAIVGAVLAMLASWGLSRRGTLLSSAARLAKADADKAEEERRLAVDAKILEAEESVRRADAEADKTVEGGNGLADTLRDLGAGKP